MKLRYEITSTTNLDPQLLNNKILLQLENLNYIVIDKTEGLINFKDDDWEIRRNSDLFKKVDRGRFEIILSGGKVYLKYTYYVSIVTELIISVIIYLFSIFVIQSYYVLLIILPLLIQLVVRLKELKSFNKDLISNILKV